MTTPAAVPDPSAGSTGRLANDRISYRSGTLGDDAPHDPFTLFEAWMDDAFARRDDVGDLPEPTALVLSTIARTPDGGLEPRSRTVLLKSADENGFVIYSGRDSAKGRELAAIPEASLLFVWLPLQRQIRIDGHVDTVPEAEASAYFASRPRGSQLSAWASEQSAPIGSRAELEAKRTEVEQRFAGRDVPAPADWTGFRVRPRRVEFWQGRPDRLHDRLLFTRRADGSWDRVRLQP